MIWKKVQLENVMPETDMSRSAREKMYHPVGAAETLWLVGDRAELLPSQTVLLSTDPACSEHFNQTSRFWKFVPCFVYDGRGESMFKMFGRFYVVFKSGMLLGHWKQTFLLLTFASSYFFQVITLWDDTSSHETGEAGSPLELMWWHDLFSVPAGMALSGALYTWCVISQLKSSTDPCLWGKISKMLEIVSELSLGLGSVPEQYSSWLIAQVGQTSRRSRRKVCLVRKAGVYSYTLKKSFQSLSWI